VTIAGPTEARPADGRTVDFVVVPDRAQLSEIVRRARDGRLRTNIGNVSTLDEAVAAFNSTERRKGKTIIRVRPLRLDIRFSSPIVRATPTSSDCDHRIGDEASRHKQTDRKPARSKRWPRSTSSWKRRERSATAALPIEAILGRTKSLVVARGCRT